MGSIGFKKKDAEKMFDFECEVIRKFDKSKPFKSV